MLAAHIGREPYDYIGTSLGGMMGMILAAMPNSPIQRLIINDIAPEVPHTAMARLGNYLNLDPYFSNLDEVEARLRETLKPFAPMVDEDWAHMARTSSRKDGKGYKLALIRISPTLMGAATGTWCISISGNTGCALSARYLSCAGWTPTS